VVESEAEVPKPALAATNETCKRIGSYLDVCVYDNICYSNGTWLFIEEAVGSPTEDGRFSTMLHHGAVYPEVTVPHGVESFLRPKLLNLPVNYFGKQE
jgi:hypothetical protein